MASSDAFPIPRKNVAYRVTFPILDADGDLVTGATALDSEISKDGGTFADCTNEATEIATASGVYFLDLTSTEMNADTVAIIVKTTTVGAKTTTIVMYPAEDADLRANVVAWNGTAPNNLVSARVDVSVGAMANDVVTAAAIANAAIDAATFAAGAIDANAIAADAIGSSELAASAVAEIADGVWDEALSGHQAAGSTGRALTLAGSILGEFTLGGTPTSTIIRLTGGSAVNDYYNDMAVMITSGALIGQTRPVLDYDGATGDITVDEPFTSAPSAGVTVAILAQHTHPISQIADSVWDEAVSGHVIGGSFGAILQNASTLTLAQIQNMIIEGSLTLEQVMRVMLAAASGKSHSPVPGQRAYRDRADTKNRILANVSGGDRTTVVLDVT